MEYVFNILGYQYGGATCSICGAEGVSKATCPHNPKTKNTKPDKHNKTPLKAAKKSSAKKVAPLSFIYS